VPWRWKAAGWVGHDVCSNGDFGCAAATMTPPCSRKNEPTVTIWGKQWRARVPNLQTRHPQIRCYRFGYCSPSKVGRGIEPKETKYENRKHAFGCILSGTFGRHLDITRLGATTSRVGGRRCTMSGSGRESISDRRRIRGYEERSRTWVQVLPRGPWLPSLSVGRPAVRRTCRLEAPGEGDGCAQSASPGLRCPTLSLGVAFAETLA
jgi:hypothetical protein